MMKLDSKTFKLAAICVAGIIFNVFCSIVVQYFELPVFFDTVGTVFIAVLGGYVPGVAVGFFTNLFASGFNINEMYFGFVNVAIAIISAFLAGRGYYDKFSKVLLTIPATALMTAFLGSFLEEMLAPTRSFESLENFGMHFLKNCPGELFDKGLAIIVAFLLLKLIPTDWKESFKSLGKMQAPLSPEMQAAMKARKNLVLSPRIIIAFILVKLIPDSWKKDSKLLNKIQAWLSPEITTVTSDGNDFILSLRTKMVFNFMSVTIFVAVSISAISYAIYQDTTIKDRIRIADGIVTMVVNEINPKRVDEFIELGYKAEGYDKVKEALYRIRASNSDIKYLYVYKIMEDGCHVVFDLDTANLAASPPGDVIEFDESFTPYLDDLFAGRPIPPIISNDKYGHLLTIYKPVYNSIGKCTCYAAIDFSMEQITEYGKTFIARVIAIFSGAVVFIFVLGITFIENNIILPVNTMACCARNFVYDSEEARKQNIEQIQSLDIKTKDEIENLYSAFVKTTSDSMHYFENFRKAKIEVEVMDKLAHTDSLTGIKNKTAYIERTSKFDADIVEGKAAFAIVMIDVNYLKKVNDTYGHERGNEYLINACNLACDIFGRENVYRVGGDEFVAVLEGEDLAHCEEIVARIRAEVKRFRADKSLQPWEKVSAAVGMAYYQAGVDQTADEVFKRADADMYEKKLAMKAVRTD